MQSVFLNGVWIGIRRNPMELVRTLRALRRQVRMASRNKQVVLIVHAHS
jgi:hypothetical protein